MGNVQKISSKDGMVVVKTPAGEILQTARQARERFEGMKPIINKKDSKQTDMMADYNKAIRQAEEARKG